jgi:chromate transporter
VTTQVNVRQPSFREASAFWWKLGWITFGGTAAHISIMHHELVDEKRWISEEAFLHGLSHCMILPGPEAQQLAIYIGWRLHGRPGGVVAGTLFVLPSMFVLLGLSIIYVQFGKLSSIAAMFAGLKPAVLALVIVAIIRVASRTLRSVLQWVVASGTFAAMYFCDWPLPAILLVVGALGVAVGLIRPEWIQAGPHTSQMNEEIPSSPSAGLSHTYPLRSLFSLIGAALFLWSAPVAYLYLYGSDFSFWKTLVLFFTKTAFVTVGGSYTVIPYVAKIVVSQFHWLTNGQMTDGFALAETTPGPLIIVVAFVGFMAGYNHFQHSFWMGTLGLLMTTFYTFLPCFLLVFAGAPLVERSQGTTGATKGALTLITAVVVGAMVDLLFFLARNVLLAEGTPTFRSIDWISVVWMGSALLLLARLKIPVVYLVLLSMLFGLIRLCIQSTGMLANQVIH